MYIPPGRQPYNRDELNPSEDEIKLGPKIVDNFDLCRTRFAMKDFTKTLRQTILNHDVNSKQYPSEAMKPAMKNLFFINEQRWNDQNGFVEPDDESLEGLDTFTGNYLVDYIKEYNENPRFVEQNDQTTKALKNLLSQNIPLPGYARFQLGLMKKLYKQEKIKNDAIQAELDAKKAATRKKGKTVTVVERTINKNKIKPVYEEDDAEQKKIPMKKAKFNNDPKLTSKIKIGKPIFKREVREETTRAGYM